MLIYLDSSHFALLERAADQARSAFFRHWQDAGCELAVSLHHTQEIAQLPSSESVRRRLLVLKDFPLIRYRPASSATVLGFEVQVQMLQRLGYSVDSARSALDTLFPRAKWQSILNEVMSAEAVFKKARVALELSAEASQSSKTVAMATHPIPSPEFFASTEEAIAALLEASPTLDRRAKALIAELTQSLSKAPIQDGIRPALIELFGLGELAIVDAIPSGDLSAAKLFVDAAKESSSAVLGRVDAPGVPLGEVLNSLNPYEAPGYALKVAVARARRAHPRADTASDHVDEDHVSFAPYVDLLFVDKRTHGFVNQEGRHRPLLLPDHTTQSIVRGADLEAVMAAISERRLTSGCS